MVDFVVEESSWAWDGVAPEAYVARIDQFLARLDVARQRGESYVASSEWLQQQILPGWSLGDLFWDADSPLELPRDIREVIVASIGRMQFWDDEHPMGEIEAVIQGRPVISPSAVFVHELLGRSETVACLALPGPLLSGRLAVEVAGTGRLMFFVTDEASHREFFRTAIVEAKLDVAAVTKIAPHAYPDTYFVDDIWRDVRSFVGGYDAVRESLLGFLAVYDDHGHWIFTDVSGRISPDERSSAERKAPLTPLLIERRFSALGFDVAPENPDVWRNGRTRRARERTIEGETAYCEWHLKLMPHQNRVHLHGPIPATNDRVIVAIFCEHLPLP